MELKGLLSIPKSFQSKKYIRFPKPKPQAKPKPQSKPKPKPQPKIDSASPKSGSLESEGQHSWETAHFTLQVKAFRTESEAEAYLDLLHEHWPELPTRILKGKSRQRAIYRVLLGAFAQRAQAQKVRSEFMKKFGAKDRPFVKGLR